MWKMHSDLTGYKLPSLSIHKRNKRSLWISDDIIWMRLFFHIFQTLQNSLIRSGFIDFVGDFFYIHINGLMSFWKVGPMTFSAHPLEPLGFSNSSPNSSVWIFNPKIISNFQNCVACRLAYIGCSTNSTATFSHRLQL